MNKINVTPGNVVDFVVGEVVDAIAELFEVSETVVEVVEVVG